MVKSLVPWEKALINGRVVGPFGFDVQTNSDHKIKKIKLYSVTTLKRYLNEKNLIHGRRVIATISKFSSRKFLKRTLVDIKILKSICDLLFRNV